MVKLTAVPSSDPGKAIAEELAAETIQANYRRHQECKPAIKLKRINSEEKLVQDIAADVIKSGIKRSNSTKKSRIPGTPPMSKPSPRADTMAAQEAAGAVAWLEIKKIVVRGLQYKRWDNQLDPYVELNGMVKTGVIWNGRGLPLEWTQTQSVVPVMPGQTDMRVAVLDANRIRDDVLICECVVDIQSVSEKTQTPTILSGVLSSPKYRDAKVELHVRRSSGSTYPKHDAASIRADHRKLSADDLDITSDIKPPRDLREEAKRLAQEAEKKGSAPQPERRRDNSSRAAERKAESLPAPTPAPRKESQPMREAKVVAEAKLIVHAPSRRELPADLKEDTVTRSHRKSRLRAMSPGWLEKNVEAEKKLVIDDAYNESYKKIVNQEGVHLNFKEVAIILRALGYDEAKTPPASETTEEVPDQPFLGKGVVHIPLSHTASTRDIASLFTEIVTKIDFKIKGTHSNAVGHGSDNKAEEPAATFAISIKEAKIIKEHLLSLVTGMWSRNRNFILLVCGAHPDQGGGRPSNWSISWVQKLAKKLEFPEDKFMSCTGLQFLEENRNEVNTRLGIIPSLLQARFALYQHLLRLLESWWSIPSRPSDRVDAAFKATRRQSVTKVAPGGFVPYAPPAVSKSSKRRTGKTLFTGKKEVHRMTLSPTYLKRGQRADGTMEITDKLQPGDNVVIGPMLILFPVLLSAGRDNGLDVRDHMMEKYAELVSGRSAVVSVFPYGRHVYPEMIWVALKPEDDENPQDMVQLVKQLERVDVTDILVSGRHVLIPEVCLMRTVEIDENIYAEAEPEQRKEIENNFETISRSRAGDKYVSKLEAEVDSHNHLADTIDSNWRDDYSDDGQLAYSAGVFPSSPDYYIGGGGGVDHAVVMAPLPDSVERKQRPLSAPSGHHRSLPPHKSMLNHVDPALRESADGQWDTLWSHGGRGSTASPNSTLGRPKSIEDYPTPEKYINGGKGVKKAVVVAPLEDPLPNRTNREKLPGSPERDHSSYRPLYRPLPNMFDTIVPGSEKLRPRSSSAGMRPRPSSTTVDGRYTPPFAHGDHFNEAAEVLLMLSGGMPLEKDSKNLKQSVRDSVDRFNKIDNQLRGNMKKNSNAQLKKRRNSFDPLKEPVSSRPKQEDKKKKKKKWSDDYASAQDEELLRLVERMENINDIDELQDIQDSLAGHFRKRSAGGYGSPVRDPKGVYPNGIIDSMIKYKLNHDGDSNSAKMKMQKWGITPSNGGKSDSGTENIDNKKTETNKLQAPVPLKKDKFIFPWMIGEPRISDDIDPRKNERLWRALKVAERESAKKEAYLRRELNRLGVSDENMEIKDPYDAYTNV